MATSAVTVHTPFGTGKPPMPGLITFRSPSLIFPTFGVPVVSLYLYSVPALFADQFAHGMLSVTVSKPFLLSVTEAPEPLPPSATQRGSAELPVAPGTTAPSLDSSTILGLLLSSSFFPVMPWSVACALLSATSKKTDMAAACKAYLIGAPPWSEA